MEYGVGHRTNVRTKDKNREKIRFLSNNGSEFRRLDSRHTPPKQKSEALKGFQICAEGVGLEPTSPLRGASFQD